MNAKRTIGDWLKLSVLFLDEAIVLVLIFYLLNYYEVPISGWLAIGVVVPVVILVFVIHVKVMPSFHGKRITGREGMIGIEGEVVQPLTPVGTIRVKGENWKAETDGEHVEIGRSVTGVEIKGLKLRVVCGQED